jgi:predicted dehydrogenase
VAIRKYRAAIIGCGRVASTFDDDPMMVKTFGITSHAGAYTDNINIELVAASDISKDSLNKFGKRWKVTNLYLDYTEMLKIEEIDIVSICTWNSTHLDIMENAANNNVKAIWCEKPISDSLLNAEKMIDIAEKNEIKLIINHNRRWDNLYQEVSKFIGNGELGNIQQVSCYYTGGLANTCSHLFDVLRMFLGDVETVIGWINDGTSKDDPNMDGYLRFKNGVSATLQSVAPQSYLMFEFDIYGTKGRLRIQDNGFNLSYWKANESLKYKGLNELFIEEPPFKIVSKNMMKNAAKDIVECLKTGKEPACSGEDGLKSLEIICGFIKSANKDRTISLPLKNRNITINSK